MTSTYYGQAMNFACPRCGADVGHPCTSKGGATLSSPHKIRRQAMTETMEPLAAQMFDHAAELRTQILQLQAQAEALENAAAILSQ